MKFLRPGLVYRSAVVRRYCRSATDLVEDCLGARFEILRDGKTQYCRDTLVTAMGAANIIQRQNPKSRVAVSDLQTGQLTAIPKPATQTQ